MKRTLTLLASVLAISTISLPAIAVDAPPTRHLSKAKISAIAATRTYAKKPNGTTHALADLAFCNLSELRYETHESELATEANYKQNDALKRLRAKVKLPAFECAAKVIEFASVQMTAVERPFISAN